MTTLINRCMMRLRDRAERIDKAQIIETFVEVGPLLAILESENNQLVYGRRGVGKTHALLYLGDRRVNSGDYVIYVDCRNIGSNISMYSDPGVSRAERASRLLVDVCTRLHESLLDTVTNPDFDYDFSKSVPVLDQLVDEISRFRITGKIESIESRSNSGTVAHGTNWTISNSQIGTTGNGSNSATQENRNEERRSGDEIEWVDFGSLAKVFNDLYMALGSKRIWILVDEWSAIPIDLQPFLADLFRRTIFPCAGFTIKIGAIEHRSRFIQRSANADYIGLEVGSDITPAIDLDDYLVFDRNADKATDFFRGLITKHIMSIASEIMPGHDLTPESIVGSAFTQENVFREFVIATEGVPRDALHILQRAATKADSSAISLPHLKDAVLTYYQTDKYNSINENPDLRKMLEWIRDKVIGERRTRAFLLPVEASDELIDELFDRRALHILSRSTSAAHRPGDRFIVYKIDYGCYIDLRATDKMPTGLLYTDTDEVELPDVPEDDARSYRRAVLDVATFYSENSTGQ